MELRWLIRGGLFLTLILVGCGGDVTQGTGELGRLRYSLYTSYDVPEGKLTDARIVTGHPQRLHVSLTAQGRREVDAPSRITHRFEPSTGVTVYSDPQGDAGDNPGGSGAVPPARFLVTEPGQYTLESVVDDEVVDKIQLQLEEPAGFEVSMKVREPWGEEFAVAVGDPLQVEEGSQVLILAIPVDAKDKRLAGVMTPEITVDPKWAVTPGYNVYRNTEDITWSAGGATDYYFIEPATVTFTITDPVSGANSAQVFDVTPVDPS